MNDGYASMAIAGTLPEYRGKGVQSALLARRIADVRALGCQHIISETAEEKPGKPVPSYRNMLRMGFELLTCGLILFSTLLYNLTFQGFQTLEGLGSIFHLYFVNV